MYTSLSSLSLCAFPVQTPLNRLIARPIAHRGLHDAARGVIENTAAAVTAAIAGGYGVEVDVQVSADGEAMVHHDDVLGRLTEGEGRLDQMSAAALARVPFRDADARMMTLGELCDLIAGRATLVVELKSRFDGDPRLPGRVATVLSGYGGPAAPMSFDPMQLAVLRQKSPRLPRGIVAAKYRPPPVLGSDAARGCVTAWVPCCRPSWRGRSLSPILLPTCRRWRRFSRGTLCACRS